jgi:hypothetical protein
MKSLEADGGRRPAINQRIASGFEAAEISLSGPSKQSSADGGAWKGNQSIGLSRWRGSILFKNNFARCARDLHNRLEPMRRP